MSTYGRKLGQRYRRRPLEKALAEEREELEQLHQLATETLADYREAIRRADAWKALPWWRRLFTTAEGLKLQ